MPSLKAIKVTRRSTSCIGDDEEPLSPGAQLLNSPDLNFYILLIFTFKTPINITIFKQLMTPLLNHPRFSSLLQPVTGANHFKWVRTRGVNINDHVIVPELGTAAGTSAEEVVNGYISGLSKSGMDMSRPMWEWHVLNVKTSDAESTAVLRLHHSIGDGVSLMSLLVSLAGHSNKSKLPPPGKQQLKLNEVVSKLFRMVINTLVSCVMVFRTLFLNLRDTETPLGPTSSTGWQSRKFIQKTISLDDVKMVKNALNVTINDVMLGVVQAGVSRYLERLNYAKKDSTHRNTNLPQPKKMRVRAFVAMNLRTSSGIPDLLEMMNVKSKVRWGNKFGIVVVPFNTEQKDDVLDYVRESKSTMDKKKVSFEPNLSYLMAKFYPSLASKICSKMTLGFSNIEGPFREITLFGHQVTNIAPTVYGQYPVALGIHVGSYCNKMNIVCSVDDSVISDPLQLCNDLGEAFDTIKESVLVRSN